MVDVVKRDDETIYARTGTNANCGGVGVIEVKISPNRLENIRFSAFDFECEHIDGFGYKVAGAKLAEILREEIFNGATQAFIEISDKKGIDFQLICASSNIADLIGDKFRKLGFETVKYWFENQTRK